MRSYPLSLDLPLGEACRVAAEQLHEEILDFHEYVVREYGGNPGIHSLDMLISAAHRPFTLVDRQLAYATGVKQAAALMHSLVQNHPFRDGNKRTALLVSTYFLQQCGYWRDVIFLSRYEFEALENLILGIANEHADLSRGRRVSAYTINEIADSLNKILRPSQNRRPRPSRLISGAFYLLNERLSDNE
jgi:death-on-curing family protein